MESGSITNAQLEGSTFGVNKARLNGERYWNGGHNAWIQADLISAFIVTGLQTQGGPGGNNFRVKSLSVKTGLHVSTLQPIMETGTNITKVFYVSDGSPSNCDQGPLFIFKTPWQSIKEEGLTLIF